MIIRCRKCETSFRFEDQLMTGEGVWVRCSRCRNVFFQDNSSQEEQTFPLPEAASKTNQSGREENAGEASQVEEVDPILSRVEEIREAMAVDTTVDGRPLKEFDDREDLSAWKSPEEPVEVRPEPTSVAKEKKHGVAKFFAYLFLVLFVIIFLSGLYFWFFPENRQEVVDALAPYFPGVEILGTGQRRQNDVVAQVRLQDLRQYYVNNWLMGSLRVVEGTVLNKGNYSLTRVQVRGRIYDAGGNIVGEWVSFVGNILTDAELATLSGEEIQSRLSQPLVSGVSNDRVSPHGQIPFMVVIAHHDQQAIAKTTIMVSGAEKLLE